MEMTHRRTNPLMVNQKFLDLLTPTPYANVTMHTPAFRVRVWLRETKGYVAKCELCTMLMTLGYTWSIVLTFGFIASEVRSCHDRCTTGLVPGQFV